MPEFRRREIVTAKCRKLRAPHGEAERHAPRMMAGEEDADRDQAYRDGGDRDQRARFVISAARARDGRDDQRHGCDASQRHRKSAPCAEVIRRQHRIYTAKRQKGRQMQTSNHAADNKQRERDQHAARTATCGIERAGAAAVGELHADAEHEGADHERWPDWRDRAAEAGRECGNRHDHDQEN